MKNVKATLIRIAKYIKNHMFLVCASLLFALINVATTLLSPIVIGKAIDLLIYDGVNFNQLYVYLLYTLGLTILGGIAQWAMNLVNNQLAFKIVQRLRNDVIEKLQKLPLKYLDSIRTGDIVNNVIADAENFADGVLMGFTQLFTSVLTIVGVVVFMFIYNPIIAAAVVVLSPLSLVIARFIAKKTHAYFADAAKLKGEQTALVDEYITHGKAVKANSFEKIAEEKYDVINEKWRDASKKAVFFSSLVNPTTRLLNSAIYACVALFGGLIASGIWVGVGTLTAGGLSCLLNYSNKYTKPFNEISGLIAELTSALVAAERIFKLLDENEEESDETNIEIYPNGEIKLDSIAFSYNKEKELIKNLSLDVKKGQKIAIVGPTGCGKTTLINLLMRFYDVDEGAIYIDDMDIREVSRHSLRDAYGMVLQETWIKTASVRDNLTFGSKLPESEIENVVKACKLEGLINRLPDGYDTILKEGDLSQGEKQLLCIARVMLSDPHMLILDEATSSVDTKTEQDINKAFDILMKDKTSFVVAHRLATIINADCILVMKDGKVIEKGTHKELLDRGGFYYELYNNKYNTKIA